MFSVPLYLRVVVAAIILSAVGRGQSVQSPAPSSTDVFADWRSSANDAADRALAAALSDRPWMKSSAPANLSDQAPVAVDSLGRLRAGIERVQRLRPVIEPILRQEGVPQELSAMVLVESGGQPTILSPKGARGVWQFMPDTARRYGLAVTLVRDDRTDVEKSTRAAARYLRDLYQQFGDWRLAFAAYNAGEQRVGRALAHAGASTFVRIERSLPQETRDYVPAVMNAIAVLGNGSQLVPVDQHATPPRASIVFASLGGSE
jgi:soluble lytic murein transglycosylase-like protein